MVDLYRDFVYARVTTTVLVGDTTIQVDDPSKFPSNAVLAKADFFVSFESSLSGTVNFEVVKVLSITGSTLTVQRGVLPGYPAVAHSAFTYIKASITSDMMRRMRGGFIGPSVPPADLDIYTPGDPFFHTGEGRYYAFTQSAAQLRDTFTRADSALTMGSTEIGAINSQIYPSPWFNAIGVNGIKGNQAYTVSLGPGNEAISLTNVGSMDFDFSIDVTIPEAAAGQAECDVAFRMSTDGQNGYVLVLSPTTFTLYRKNGGVYTSIQGINPGFAAGTTHTIRVICSGNSMNCYLDGLSRYSPVETVAGFTTATAYNLIGANVGIRGYGTGLPTSTAGRWDNFVNNTAAGGGGGGWQPTADLTGQSLGILQSFEAAFGGIVSSIDDITEVVQGQNPPSLAPLEIGQSILALQVDELTDMVAANQVLFPPLQQVVQGLAIQADELLDVVSGLGTLVRSITTKTAAYVMQPTDETVLMNPTAAAICTLPTAPAIGRRYVVKNISTFPVTLTCPGAATIDGRATIVLTNQYDALMFTSDAGTNFWII